MSPITGDAAIGRTTFWTTPCHLTVLAAPMAAPISPPMRAWVDEDGRPSHQVSKFQLIAPIRAEKMITRPWVPDGLEMIPLPTVLATLVETSAPTILSPAAIPSAVRGRRALVVIDVATALAASWKPLVKSKPSATTMKRTRPARRIRQYCHLRVLRKGPGLRGVEP